MKRERQKHRFALTMFMALVFFVLQTVAVLIASAAVYLLIRLNLLDDLFGGNANFLTIIFFMAAISVAAGLVITLLTTKVSIKPINRIVDGINRLSGGDYQARLSFGKVLDSNPTFSGIADSFNTLAQELEGTQMLRQDFVNNFSHEFKTPIVSIAGFAKVLRRGDLTEDQKQEYLAVIEEESMRLSAMATNVLNMTRVENQTILSDVHRFNLSEQLRSCVLLLEGKWTKKEIDLQIDLEEHRIEADEELLKQVWINLVDNAIKFSPLGGAVSLEIREQTDTLSVSITNAGPGIPADQQKRIFNKFYQADRSHSTEGNGIGLALVKRITELHRGKVTVSSENGLTTFTVTLPKKQA